MSNEFEGDGSLARPRGRPKSQMKEAAILEASARLFMERGFEGVSIEAIAEAAGVSKVTIYARTGGKEELFRSVLRAKCEAMLEHAQLDQPPEDIREALLGLARGFAALILDPEALAIHRVIVSESARHPRMAELFMESAVGETHRRVVGYFEREVARGKLKPMDADGAAWRFLGAVKAWPHLSAALGLGQPSAEALERHFVACVDEFLIVHGR